MQTKLSGKNESKSQVNTKVAQSLQEKVNFHHKNQLEKRQGSTFDFHTIKAQSIFTIQSRLTAIIICEVFLCLFALNAADPQNKTTTKKQKKNQKQKHWLA